MCGLLKNHKNTGTKERHNKIKKFLFEKSIKDFLLFFIFVWLSNININETINIIEIKIINLSKSGSFVKYFG